MDKQNLSKLYERRLKNGWSQYRLSKNSGVSRFNISLAELGYRDLTESEMKKVSDAFTKNEKGLI